MRVAGWSKLASLLLLPLSSQLPTFLGFDRYIVYLYRITCCTSRPVVRGSANTTKGKNDTHPDDITTTIHGEWDACWNFEVSNDLMQGMPSHNFILAFASHDSTNNRFLRTTADDFTRTSEILIGSGPKEVRFLLHTSLLTQQSPYFRAALTGPFLESTTQSLRFDSVDVSTFELLVTWLYTSTIPPPFKDGKPAYYTLLHLYILADRFCFEALRNYIVDMMADLADQTNSVLTPSDTRILYNDINEGSKLRELVLDLFAFKKTDKLLASHADHWHAKFLRDLCVRLKKPCAQAMTRHRIRNFIPLNWEGSRACEGCRVVLTPRFGAVACEECAYVWCVKCYEEGVGVACWEDGRVGLEEEGEGKGRRKKCYGRGVGNGKVARWESCKPWRGSRCVVYHEHRETEACRDVFMGK